MSTTRPLVIPLATEYTNNQRSSQQPPSQRSSQPLIPHSNHRQPPSQFPAPSIADNFWSVAVPNQPASLSPSRRSLPSSTSLSTTLPPSRTYKSIDENPEQAPLSLSNLAPSSHHATMSRPAVFHLTNRTNDSSGINYNVTPRDTIPLSQYQHSSPLSKVNDGGRDSKELDALFSRWSEQQKHGYHPHPLPAREHSTQTDVSSVVPLSLRELKQAKQRQVAESLGVRVNESRRTALELYPKTNVETLLQSSNRRGRVSANKSSTGVEESGRRRRIAPQRTAIDQSLPPPNQRHQKKKHRSKTTISHENKKYSKIVNENLSLAHAFDNIEEGCLTMTSLDMIADAVLNALDSSHMTRKDTQRAAEKMDRRLRILENHIMGRLDAAALAKVDIAADATTTTIDIPEEEEYDGKVIHLPQTGEELDVPDIVPLTLVEDAAKRIQKAFRDHLMRRDVAGDVRQYMFGPLTKSLRRRNQYVRDLINSERMYVDNMYTMIQIFLKPLRLSIEYGLEILTSDDMQVIFGDFEKILNVHLELMSRLEEQTDDWPVVRIGSTLLDWTNCLGIYEDYVTNYGTLLQRLEDCKRTNPEFREAIASCEGDKATGLHSLKDYLMMPITRLHEYVPIVAGLLSSSSHDAEDYEALQATLLEVQPTAEYANEIIEMSKLEEHMASIESFLRAPKSQLLPKHLVSGDGVDDGVNGGKRTYIREGPVLVVDVDDVDQSRYLYLFNDKLFICKRGAIALEIETIVDLLDVKLEENVNALEVGSFVLVNLVGQSMEFACPTLSECYAWTRVLDQVLKKLHGTYILKEWDLLLAEHKRIDAYIAEEEVNTVKEMKVRDRIRDLGLGLADSVDSRLAYIEKQADISINKFWKTVFEQYERVKSGDLSDGAWVCEGLEPKTEAERAALGYLTWLENQAEASLREMSSQDHEFWKGVARGTGKIEADTDRRQMEAVEVLDDVTSMFELVGRKILTADNTVATRHAKEIKELNLYMAVRERLRKQLLDIKDTVLVEQEQLVEAETVHVELQAKLRDLEFEKVAAKEKLLAAQKDKGKARLLRDVNDSFKMTQSNIEIDQKQYAILEALNKAEAQLKDIGDDLDILNE